MLVEEMCGDGPVREFCNFNGYYEPDHIAEVAESDITKKNDEKVFSVSVMLPYPDIKTSEGKSFVGSIEYLPLTIRATYIGGESRVATQGR